MLATMSPTDMSLADPRELLALRLAATEKRRVWIALLYFGVAALFSGLFVALGAALTATSTMCLILAVFFLSCGLVTWWVRGTAGDRNQRFVQLLDLDPSRVDRIYGQRIVLSGRYSTAQPIEQPESKHVGESRLLLLAVELAEPSRLKRRLGLHKFSARVSREELLELLAFLRGLAPEAKGAPGKGSS